MIEISRELPGIFFKRLIFFCCCSQAVDICADSHSWFIVWCLVRVIFRIRK